MQGFILHVRKAKNEDTIVHILTGQRLEALYRFYGARHPTVTTGYKIDFEIERDDYRFLPRLRHVLHLGYPWLTDTERLHIWQHFVALLYEHLKGIETPGAFYYDLLEQAASIWHLQNPLRATVEAYLRLLEHEGRLHRPETCFVCNQPLESEIGLIRAYLCAHPGCVIAPTYARSDIETLFETGKTLYLGEKEVESLWMTLLEGM